MSGKPFNKREPFKGQQRGARNSFPSRGGFQQRDQAPRKSFNNFAGSGHQKLQPGSYSKGGKAYLGKREKLKERQNYASKVKSKFAKQLHRKTPADGDDAAFAETPDFYKEIFAEVDRENSLKKSSGGPNEVRSDEASEASEQEDAAGDLSDSDAASLPENTSPSAKRTRDHSAPQDPEASESTGEKNSHKKAKPNPFKKSLEDLEKQQQELEKIKKDAANEAARRKNEQKNKKRQRKQITAKHMRRSKTGQPILGNQISLMLSKLEKS